MIIGIDWYDTMNLNIDAYLPLFKDNTCYIISAVKLENVERLERDVGPELRPYLQAVIFDDYNDVPKLKHRVAQSLNVELMIDDRLDTCEYFIGNAILAVQPPKLRPIAEPKIIRHKTLAEAKAYNMRHIK